VIIYTTRIKFCARGRARPAVGGQVAHQRRGAAARGGDRRSWHGSLRPTYRHHRRGHRAFGLWPWYGYYDAPSYPYDDSYSTDSTPQVVAPEPPRPTCQHSEQTVTVRLKMAEHGRSRFCAASPSPFKTGERGLIRSVTRRFMKSYRLHFMSFGSFITNPSRVLSNK
jgi:hypothetical protein